MTLSTVFRRRATRRPSASGADRGIVLVVALMMSLVFAPVIGLHLAASTLAPVEASTAASPVAVDLAAQPKGRTGPG